MNDNLWFQWHILQSKINTPLILNKYSFIDNDNHHKNIPPPPPLPPKSLSKYDKMIKFGISEKAVQQKINFDKITSKDLQNVSLKKINPKKQKKKSNKNDFIPSIEELRETLLKLKKIN